jgi:hypothetical protein
MAKKNSKVGKAEPKDGKKKPVTISLYKSGGITESVKHKKIPPTRKPFRPNVEGVTQKQLDKQRSSLPKVTEKKTYHSPNPTPKAIKMLLPNKCYFLNAQSKKDNSSGYTPSKTELDKIKVGDSVKVAIHIGTANDFFWATVLSISGSKLKAEVEVKTSYSDYHGIEEGKTIEITKDNVFKAFKN